MGRRVGARGLQHRCLFPLGCRPAAPVKRGKPQRALALIAGTVAGRRMGARGLQHRCVFPLGCRPAAPVKRGKPQRALALIAGTMAVPRARKRLQRDKPIVTVASVCYVGAAFLLRRGAEWLKAAVCQVKMRHFSKPHGILCKPIESSLPSALAFHTHVARKSKEPQETASSVPLFDTRTWCDNPAKRTLLVDRSSLLGATPELIVKGSSRTWGANQASNTNFFVSPTSGS